MLEMLKRKSLSGLIILFVGFTYVKTLPIQQYQKVNVENDLFLYGGEK